LQFVQLQSIGVGSSCTSIICSNAIVIDLEISIALVEDNGCCDVFEPFPVFYFGETRDRKKRLDILNNNLNNNHNANAER
jgi:hypothetical protein